MSGELPKLPNGQRTEKPPAYSPQLGARLGISHTQLNIVGLAGNGAILCSSWIFAQDTYFIIVGVYSSGPVWGKIVDSRGPRILLVCSFLFLLGGYSGMRYLYDTGLPADVEHLSIIAFCALVLFSYLTGAGGNGGLVSSVNSTAKTFPDKAVCLHTSFWPHTINPTRSARQQRASSFRDSGYRRSSSLAYLISFLRETHPHSCFYSP